MFNEMTTNEMAREAADCDFAMDVPIVGTPWVVPADPFLSPATEEAPF